ncbi:CDGSH iron-sulfur domain-containing protein [Paenimyroides baculatum]|uniref:CDGSH iron-sulfur domain-containing protein n=1 Tax=Paenimyroides baculatum TaxID=2608000 RepID=UPI001CC21D7C|nr:CDGSH iron-sulfur domain-containing protein [Paenimyroides baculatum]
MLENGPLLCSGKITIVYPDGRIEEKQNNTALCRCGASANKPFCDGNHNKIGFKG